MKKAIVIFVCHLFTITAFGQSEAVNVVKQFGENISTWCSTQMPSHRKAAQQKCSEGCRVKDEIMMDFGKKSGLVLKDYVIISYLNGFQRALGDGNVFFELTDLKVRTNNELSFSYGNAPKEAKRLEGYTLISCKITVSGSIKYDVKDLFYVKEGKIEKITPFEEVVDKNTGAKKIVVDFSDLESEETWGLSLNYGKHFPVGVSVNYTPADSYFMLSVDLGLNFDDDKYIIDDVKMTDIMNYERTKKVLDPKFYLTVTPQFYMKYFAVGCGVGFLYMDGDKETAYYKNSSTSSSSASGGASVSSSYVSSSSNYNSESTVMVKPMIRPVVKGFIPLNDEWYLSVSAGYDLIFGYKEKNGFNVGIGLQWEL